MTNKAVSKAVVQTMLITLLVITANAIKPFSFGNVAMHTLAAARSFSFVLPDAAVEGIEHANYLAQAYGKSLFDDNESNSIWTKENVMKSGLLASNGATDFFDGAGLEDAEIKDVRSNEPARKPVQTRRSIRRIKRDDRDEDAGCSTKHQEIAVLPPAPAIESIAMVRPMIFPALNNGLNNGMIKAHAIPAVARKPLPALLSVPADCSKIEVKLVKLASINGQSADIRIGLIVVPKQATVIAQCAMEQKAESEKAEIEEVESLTETKVGPQEDLFSEPTAPLPFVVTPLSPECIKQP